MPKLSGGGAERAALNLAPALLRYRGVVVTEWSGGELEGVNGAEEVRSISRGSRRPPRAVRVVRLARGLNRLRPVMVISFLSPLVATEACRLAGVPVMHWLQNPFSRIKPFEGGGAAASVNRRVLRHVTRRSAALIGASPGTIEELIPLVSPSTPLAVIPNPVRLPAMAEVAQARPARIVSIGRLAHQKRHDILLEGFARVADTCDARLVIFGTGPLKHKLEEQAWALGIGHRVDFEGFVEAPAEHLHADDVFALCSDFEGFGNVFAEALARGSRVVATDAPYGAAFVLDGLDLAELVPPGSPAAVADALTRALRSGPPSEAVRLQARAKAETFGVERVAEAVQDLLDRVIGDS